MSRHFRKILAFTLAGALSGVACSKKEEAAAPQEGIRAENGQTTSKSSPAAADPQSNMVPTDTAAAPTTTATPTPAPVGGGATGAAGVSPTTPPPPPGIVAQGKMGARADRRAGGQYAIGYKGVPAKQPIAATEGSNSEDYTHYEANKMIAVSEDPLSTFAADVDTASYSIVRKKILAGENIPADAVRVEEFLNYFRYEYAPPAASDDRPFAVHVEAAPSPFSKGRHILRVGVKGKEVGKSARKKAHLTFLVDVSGSMQAADKLPLAKQALRILVNNLNDGDTVALVTYAGSTRVVLTPTGLDKKEEIFQAIEDLTAGGSTGMASGMELAYREAGRNMSSESESRVIVMTDGDTNVGTTSWEDILKSVEGYRKEGITLSTIGFGMGNYKDTLMEQLADKGNGNYYYIDGLSEAKKVFQEQLGGTLEVIAQDVKLQVEFNPAAVSQYRLIGYENRDVADVDFRNDKVDAGEIGAGHTVTAMYEVVLAKDGATDLATVRIRAKRPRGKEAAEWAYPMTASDMAKSFEGASADFRFATAVMGAAEIMRKSPYASDWSMSKAAEIARGSQVGSEERAEFLSLLGKPIQTASR
jgi:Ca-activated chloride channel homolog